MNSGYFSQLMSSNGPCTSVSRYKCLTKYMIFLQSRGSATLNMPQIHFRTPLGELTTLPDPLVGWGGDSPPHSPSLDAYGVSISAPKLGAFGASSRLLPLRIFLLFTAVTERNFITYFLQNNGILQRQNGETATLQP